MKSYTGTQAYPFLEMVRDTIEAHGIAFAVRYYGKRLNQWELRFWMRAAIA